MNKSFQFWNNLIGWLTFGIATTVYLLTIEPTTSLWDCGEFIATAYKLEVMHPPGAPLFMIMGRFFSIFASGPETAAKMINAMSALSSSFTILFLFWTITHLARKIVSDTEKNSVGNLIAIIGAGFVGALAYTFSDSFWFSAVEGEVYAVSSFFTAITFWAILKWENVADEPNSNRWLLLIAYLLGLSIGVHLLNLLSVPAIVLVYYFKKYKVTPRGIFYSLAISVGILVFIQYAVIQWFVRFATFFELMFVNGFKLPYNSGVLFYILLVIAGVVYGIHYTQKHRKVVLNTVLLSFAMIMIGYSSYALIIIRSSVNPPMDMNNPETVFDLLPYLNREQYGQRPLVKGQYYNAPVIATKETRANYYKSDGRYKIKDHKIEYVFDEQLTTIFPRMYSNDPKHVSEYERWVNVKGSRVQIRDRNGETQTVIKPSFGTNLAFFFKYQLGHMYFRYFMWNFSGKQNDIQGHGGLLHGNWITGLDFLDEARLGNLDKLPAKYREHPARNTYYMLPLLLGLLGVFFHYGKRKKDFSVVMVLFIITGVAIVVYLNQKPMEPRERDYAYAASFYAFAIWIGLGVLSVYEFFKKKLPLSLSAGIATVLSLALVPSVMAKDNWDDHDRSGRYTARDLAHNYLNSCPPGAILYTNGDNDTFPLWYAQEVEGIRTDVRIINLMLFNTEWYIDQMTRKAYDSEPIPMSLPPSKYLDGTNNIIYMMDRVDNHVDLKEVIEFVASEDPRTKFNPQPGVTLDYIPTKKFSIPIDKEKILRNGVVAAKDSALILDKIEWTLGKSSMLKNELMQLDILATTDWDRPICFVAAGNDGSMKLEAYLQMEGLAYRLVPIATTGRNFLTYGRIDVDTLYERLMNTFKYGRMEQPDVHLDYYNIRTLSVIKLRNKFTRLANELINVNKMDSASLALDRCLELMPHPKVPFDAFVPPIANAYFRCGEKEKGTALMREHVDAVLEDLTYYYDLEPVQRQSLDYEIRLGLQMLQEYNSSAAQFEVEEMVTEINEQFNDYYQRYLQERK
ncbi:MAG TPA: DUF2723 domain-containing protein [Bacteroides sp.]|nr:DUF2723 domain-containing protein [Bacteroides sp.]